MIPTATRKRWELRLARCCHLEGGPAPTIDGVREFVAHENGELALADMHTPYGRHLVDCKRWFEWTINEHAARYGTDEWPGWHQLEQDLKDDPAMLRMIRQRIGHTTGEQP